LKLIDDNNNLTKDGFICYKSEYSIVNTLLIIEANDKIKYQILVLVAFIEYIPLGLFTEYDTKKYKSSNLLQYIVLLWNSLPEKINARDYGIKFSVFKDMKQSIQNMVGILDIKRASKLNYDDITAYIFSKKGNLLV